MKMSRYKEKRKTPLKDKILITLFSLIITASVLCVAGVYLMNTRFLANTDDPNADGKLNTDIVTPKEIKDKCVNFLVTGIDYQEGSSRGKLTDVIMVVSFDIEGKNIDVLQIPRDTYIGNITSTGKINAIYGKSEDGGIEGLATAIFMNFNITIDHYVTLNMDGFRSLIDKIGGIDVNVPKTFTLEEVTIEAGMQHLTGFQAEKLVRERHAYSNGDLGRIETQKVFMKALVSKVFSMGKSEIVKLAPSLLKDVTTDLNLSEVLGYYNKLLEVDQNAGINFHTAPVLKGGNYRGNSVVVLNKEELTDLLNEHFRPYTSLVPVEELGLPTL